MIRQAAISLVRRGGISYRRQSLPKCTQTLIQNLTPNIGGCRQHRLLTTNTTTSSTTPKVSKDKGQEALEKSQRLHAELKEVSDTYDDYEAQLYTNFILITSLIYNHHHNIYVTTD